MVLDVDALCVVPSFIYFYFLLSALDLLCFASLCCYSQCRTGSVRYLCLYILLRLYIDG